MQSEKGNKLFVEKVVLITGASSGIGASTAIYLSKLGALLSLHGRNVDKLQKVADQCEKPKPHLITGDMTNEDNVKNILQSTLERYGRLDVLINNAGILDFGTIENTSLEQYDRIFNINVRSIYQLTMLVVPHLIKTKGNIVNVSSVNGTRAFSGILSYCMSKASIDQFTRCVALELISKQVRVNAVNPGIIQTNLFRSTGMSEEEEKRYLERSKVTHALGRPGTVEEVVKTIAFLISDRASFITGQTVNVDGGRSVMCSVVNSPPYFS